MKRPQILIVDDDKDYAAKLARVLEGLFDIETCHSESDFRECFAVGRFDLLIIDMRLVKDREGLMLLKEVVAQDPLQATIVMTAYADTETYTDALESGALTYLDKREFSPALIARTVDAIVRQNQLRKRMSILERRLDITEPLEIIGVSPGIRHVRDQLRLAADNDSMIVLITGESGTGKDLVARNIHQLSRRRRDGPFVCASCGQIPSNVLPTALWGVCQRSSKRSPQEIGGWMDDAKDGLLFIKGMLETNEEFQVAFIRMIESGSFTRVGGKRQLSTNAQIIIAESISAQSEDVWTAFRDRLTDKVSGLDIHLPALRERKEDIPLLAQYLLQRLYRQGKTQARSIRSGAMAALESLPWPGNIRELRSAIEYAAIRADATGMREIGPEHLPQSVSESPLRPSGIATALDYQLNLARSELALVESAMERFDTSKKSDLAAKLGYHDRFTFARRIRRTLTVYPTLPREFPKMAALFTNEEKTR